MGQKRKLHDEHVRKIKRALLSCKTEDQVTTLINWVGRLKISKSLETDKALYNFILEHGKTITSYINYQYFINNG